jgi:uncharacterized membrane protein YkoI
MRRRIAAAAVAFGVAGGAATGIALAAGAGGSPGLDDGAGLLPRATIGEDQAIAAARTAATGGIGEVDLEHRDGRLVYNVDVGASDVQVDAASGAVLGVVGDD